MNLLKILNFYKYSLLSYKGASRLFRTLLSFREHKGEITLKTLGLRLNARFYNKLSKEVEDSRDLEDKHIYT